MFYLINKNLKWGIFILHVADVVKVYNAVFQSKKSKNNSFCVKPVRVFKRFCLMAKDLLLTDYII